MSLLFFLSPDNGLTNPGTNQCTINRDTVIARPLYSAEIQPTTQYMVTAVDTVTGWFSMRTVRIAPNPKPVITANQQSYCAGDTIKLSVPSESLLPCLVHVGRTRRHSERAGN